ncbi:ammonium transporter [soil metagenome]
MMILLLIGAIVMRVGLGLYAGGSVRSKNVASVLGRNVLDWSIGILAFWAVGMAIASQTSNAYFGIDHSLLFNGGTIEHGLAGFALMSVIGAITIGATAERSRLWPMMLLSFVTAGVIFPIVFAWERFGWLNASSGFLDSMGAASVHFTGAVIAWMAIRFVGPRDTKYHTDGSTSVIPGHSLPMSVLGAWLASIGGILLIGSLSDSSFPITNVLLGTAASVVACALYFQLRYSKIDLPVLAASMLGGVVAMSAAPGVYSQRAAVLVGAITGVLIAFSIITLDLVQKWDDVTGAVSIHGVAGAWGVLAAGLFRPEGPISWGRGMAIQAGGLLAIGLLALIVTAATLGIVSLFTTVRTRASDEFDGLDLAEHDIGAYPDFQQNSIKSFHLREM